MLVRCFHFHVHPHNQYYVHLLTFVSVNNKCAFPLWNFSGPLNLIQLGGSEGQRLALIRGNSWDFSLPPCPDRLWAPPTFPSKKNAGNNWQERETLTIHLHLVSMLRTGAVRQHLHPPHVFMTWQATSCVRKLQYMVQLNSVSLERSTTFPLARNIK